MDEGELLAAFKQEILDRYGNIRIEENLREARKKGYEVLTAHVKGWKDLNIFEIREVFGVDTCRHILNIRVKGMEVVAEPGYYRTGMPLIKEIKMDLTDPSSFDQLFDFIDTCGGVLKPQFTQEG